VPTSTIPLTNLHQNYDSWLHLQAPFFITNHSPFVKYVLPTLGAFVKLSLKITTLGAFGCLLHHKNQHEKHTDWLLITNNINAGGTSTPADGDG